VPRVYAGTATFPIEVAGDVLSRYREWAATAPDEVSTAVVIRREDDRSVLVIKAMYAGDETTARRVLRPLWTAAGPAIREEMQSLSYADAAMGGTAARYLDLFRTLPDAVIDTVLAAHAATGSTVEIRHWGGAMANPAAGSGPVGHRDVPFSIILDAPTAEAAAALSPHAVGGAFLNFVSDPTRVEQAFTASNLRRLREVKRFYDPTNLFRLGLNIAPAGAPAARHLRAA
jgi:hypothetical protein